MSYSHYKRISGIEGSFVGKKGEEVRTADATGVLYNLGARLVPAGQKVEKFVTLAIAHNTAGLATGVLIASLPANSVITSLACKIDTVWNSGTTAVIDIGYGASLNELIAAQDAKALGLKTLVTNAVPMVRAAATDVKVEVTVDGTLATTGAAHITLGYI